MTFKKMTALFTAFVFIFSSVPVPSFAQDAVLDSAPAPAVAKPADNNDQPSEPQPASIVAPVIGGLVALGDSLTTPGATLSEPGPEPVAEPEAVVPPAQVEPTPEPVLEELEPVVGDELPAPVQTEGDITVIESTNSDDGIDPFFLIDQDFDFVDGDFVIKEDDSTEEKKEETEQTGSEEKDETSETQLGALLKLMAALVTKPEFDPEFFKNNPEILQALLVMIMAMPVGADFGKQLEDEVKKGFDGLDLAGLILPMLKKLWLEYRKNLSAEMKKQFKDALGIDMDKFDDFEAFMKEVRDKIKALRDGKDNAKLAAALKAYSEFITELFDKISDYDDTKDKPEWKDGKLISNCWGALRFHMIMLTAVGLGDLFHAVSILSPKDGEDGHRFGILMIPGTKPQMVILIDQGIMHIMSLDDLKKGKNLPKADPPYPTGKIIVHDDISAFTFEAAIALMIEADKAFGDALDALADGKKDEALKLLLKALAYYTYVRDTLKAGSLLRILTGESPVGAGGQNPATVADVIKLLIKIYEDVSKKKVPNPLPKVDLKPKAPKDPNSKTSLPAPLPGGDVVVTLTDTPFINLTSLSYETTSLPEPVLQTTLNYQVVSTAQPAMNFSTQVDVASVTGGTTTLGDSLVFADSNPTGALAIAPQSTGLDTTAYVVTPTEQPLTLNLAFGYDPAGDQDAAGSTSVSVDNSITENPDLGIRGGFNADGGVTNLPVIPDLGGVLENGGAMFVNAPAPPKEKYNETEKLNQAGLIALELGRIQNGTFNDLGNGVEPDNVLSQQTDLAPVGSVVTIDPDKRTQLGKLLDEVLGATKDDKGKITSTTFEQALIEMIKAGDIDSKELDNIKAAVSALQDAVMLLRVLQQMKKAKDEIALVFGMNINAMGPVRNLLEPLINGGPKRGDFIKDLEDAVMALLKNLQDVIKNKKKIDPALLKKLRNDVEKANGAIQNGKLLNLINNIRQNKIQGVKLPAKNNQNPGNKLLDVVTGLMSTVNFLKLPELKGTIK